MIICSFLFFSKEFTMTQQQNHKPTTTNVQIQSHQGDSSIGHSPQFVVTPASGPLRNHIHLIEANPLFQQEMLREVKSVANQRLASLDLVYQTLQQEANRVVGAAQRDLALHNVFLNGTKIRGQAYYLYIKSTHERFFSLLSPSEYGQISTNVSCMGHYRLNYDGSWTRLDTDDLLDQLKYVPKSNPQSHENVSDEE
jgi:hypothetical protein